MLFCKHRQATSQQLFASKATFAALGFGDDCLHPDGMPTVREGVDGIQARPRHHCEIWHSTSRFLLAQVHQSGKG